MNSQVKMEIYIERSVNGHSLSFEAFLTGTGDGCSTLEQMRS